MDTQCKARQAGLGGAERGKQGGQCTQASRVGVVDRSRNTSDADMASKALLVWRRYIAPGVWKSTMPRADFEPILCAVVFCHASGLIAQLVRAYG